MRHRSLLHRSAVLALTALTFGCVDRRYEKVPQQLGLPYASRTVEGNTVTIEKDGHVFIFTIGSRICKVNGICYYLHQTAGETTLNKLDCRILRHAIVESMPPKEKLKILLDAGHGGADPGCKYGTATESEITLAITLEVKRLLEARGHTIALTRENNARTLTLDERSLAAEGKDFDAFVSIHVNFTQRNAANGIEVFTIPAPGCDGSLENSPARAPMIGQQYLITATRLAFEVQRELLAQSFNPTDRGIKHAHFKVLRDTPAPSILIETGFLSNESDYKFLTDPTKQQETAQAIARGIERALVASEE